MEFWGIEVKAGKPIKADPGADYVIHLSQASLGESKNKAESVPLYVNADGKKLVIGTLSSQNTPQLSFDLVFDQEFELSHHWKNGSVYFLGYKTYYPEGGESDYTSSDEEDSKEEMEFPAVAAAENGKAKADKKAAKPEAVKPALKIAEPSKKTDDDFDEDDDSDAEDDSEDDDSDEMSMDDSSDEDEDENDETPKMLESSKKRPAEAVTPVSTKKSKATVTPPQKTVADGKKGGHTATPHPAKQAGKNSAKNSNPKSGGQFSSSHKKAKHGGK